MIAVVGAGIAGLSAAFQLSRDPRVPGPVRVYEADPTPGGKIRSIQRDGYLLESGPNAFLGDAPDTWELCRALRLEARMLRARAQAKKRYLLHNGRLEALPLHPGQLLTTSLLSLRGKLSLLGEPFRRKKSPSEDESVADFFRRRLGKEVLNGFVDAMAAGVFGGDPRELEMRSAFPGLYRLEQQHGSLFRGVARRALSGLRPGARKSATTKKGLWSFRGGMSELIHALERELHQSLHCSTPVRAFEPSSTGYRIAAGTGTIDNCRLLILALPAPGAAAMLQKQLPGAADLLNAIPYAPLISVSLGFDLSRITHDLDGFGFLVPSKERRRILGAIWNSQVFPGRNPDGKVLLTVLLGGSRHPEVHRLDDAQLLGICREELSACMGINAPPELSAIHRHPAAIPQYLPGHAARIARLEGMLREHLPGVFLCGDYLHGVGVNATIAQAGRTADRIAKQHLDPA